LIQVLLILSYKIITKEIRSMKRITTISILAAIMLLSVSLGFALEHTIGLRGGTAIPFVDRDEESKLKIMGG
jgi:hypothetical protein